MAGSCDGDNEFPSYTLKENLLTTCIRKSVKGSGKTLYQRGNPGVLTKQVSRMS